jgi:hypothetical protein
MKIVISHLIRTRIIIKYAFQNKFPDVYTSLHMFKYCNPMGFSKISSSDFTATIFPQLAVLTFHAPARIMDHLHKILVASFNKHTQLR